MNHTRCVQSACWASDSTRPRSSQANSEKGRRCHPLCWFYRWPNTDLWWTGTDLSQTWKTIGQICHLGYRSDSIQRHNRCHLKQIWVWTRSELAWTIILELRWWWCRSLRIWCQLHSHVFDLLERKLELVIVLDFYTGNQKCFKNVGHSLLISAYSQTW